MASASVEEITDEEDEVHNLAYQETGTVAIEDLSMEEIKAFVEQQKKAPPKKMQFDGVQVPKIGPASAIKKKVAFEEKPKEPEPPKTPPKDRQYQREVHPPQRQEATMPKPPATRFRAPIEDGVIPSAIIERLLVGEIKLTPRELLALAPEARKILRELVTTKRLPQVDVTYSEQTDELQYVLRYEEDGGREELLTAYEIDALRVVHPILNGSIKVEGILDQGSEIIAINKNIWQQLEVSLDPQKILSMQSANSQSNATHGVVSDVILTLGGIDLPLPLHVVEGAPFDLLIGRPFFRFTSCQTRDFSNGSQEITITCPNTGKRATLPTSTKSSKKTALANKAQGFQSAEHRTQV